MLENRNSKIGYVLEEYIKGILQASYKPVSESEFEDRFYTTYPFLNLSNSLKYNLEYWYISDGITLCKYNHFSELEFRNRALQSVKNRDDYKSLSTFQLLDFLYLIDCLVWVDKRMIGIQIASLCPNRSYRKEVRFDKLGGRDGNTKLVIPNINKVSSVNNSNKGSNNNELSKYSSLRSLAKKGIHSWLDGMIVVYSSLEHLMIPGNKEGLINSISKIANSKPLLRSTSSSYNNPDSIYQSAFRKGHKPFLVTIDAKGVSYTHSRAILNEGNLSCDKLFKVPVMLSEGQEGKTLNQEIYINN